MDLLGEIGILRTLDSGGRKMANILDHRDYDAENAH